MAAMFLVPTCLPAESNTLINGYIYFAINKAHFLAQRQFLKLRFPFNFSRSPPSNFSSQCPPSGCIWSWFSARGRQGCSTRCQECGFILIKDHWSQSRLMTTGHQQIVGTISCFNGLRFKSLLEGLKHVLTSFRISAHCWSPLSLQNGKLRNKHEDVLRCSGINPLEWATLLNKTWHSGNVINGTDRIH